MTYQFNIQLKGITKPPVWRRVLMPDTFTFEKFHEVIQAAFGWDDSHLFGFIGKTNKGNFDISIPDDFLDKFSRQKTIDANKTKPYWRKIPTARKHRISLTGWGGRRGNMEFLSFRPGKSQSPPSYPVILRDNNFYCTNHS